MLQPQQSRIRQQRLLPILQDRKLDAVILGSPHHVYYASAHFTGWQHQSVFVLFSDGRSWLSSANAPNANAAADEKTSFEANWNGTLRQEQPAVAAAQVVDVLRQHQAKHVGFDASPVSSQVAAAREFEMTPIDFDLFQLRRRKDADELELMRTAISCTEAMYRRAKEIVEPGIAELTVFTELNAAAVKYAGEPLTALLGNDYAAGVGGGPARGNHVAQVGQIYVLDLGPVYRGYFSDNCRSFSVDGKVTDAQQQAWQTIVDALAIVERMARPGVRCRDIYSAIDEHYRQRTGSGQSHHLGHGVGLQPHEYPHLNPKWDDVLMEGEIFTAEPGLYGPHINGGMRIENDYLVTGDGVENLLNFPLGLT